MERDSRSASVIATISQLTRVRTSTALRFLMAPSRVILMVLARLHNLFRIRLRNLLTEAD